MKTRLFYTFLLISFMVNAQKIMKFTSDGHLGIGEDNPTALLHLKTGPISSTGPDARIRLESAHNEGQQWDIISSGGSFLRSGNFGIIDVNSKATRFVIDNSGNVGIGTTIPTKKLEVRGDINVQWGSYYKNGTIVPDFVFNKDYNLISIDEQGVFMKEQKHLPKLYGAKKIENDEGVYDIALRIEQTVEELEKAHLYIQQLNSMIKNVNAKNEEILKKFDKLLTKNVELEQEIQKLKNR